MVKLLSSHVNFEKFSSDAMLAMRSYARIELFFIHAFCCGALRCRALHANFGVHNFALLRHAIQRVVLRDIGNQALLVYLKNSGASSNFKIICLIQASLYHLQLCLSLSILLFKSLKIGNHFDMNFG